MTLSVALASLRIVSSDVEDAQPSSTNKITAPISPNIAHQGVSASK